MANKEPESFGLLMTAAVGLHELFTSYMDAGFTRAEALALVIALMQANSGGSRGE